MTQPKAPVPDVRAISRLIEERRVTPESEHRITVAEVTRLYACANPACEYVERAA